MFKKAFSVAILLFAMAMWYPNMVGAVAPIKMKLEPSQVDISISYNGCNVSITGKIPSDTEVLVRMVGPSEDLKLKKKGRALGLLWMNLGSVELHNVPSVFLLFPSKALAALSAEHPEQWRRLGLGFEALQERIEVRGATEDKETIFNEFVKLKENAELYGVVDDAVQYANTDQGMKPFTCMAALPSALPQGTYTIEAFALKDNAILASGTERIRAAETGITATMASLAFNHGTMYGVLAVLVAIFAGLITGFFFKGGGAH